VPRETLAPVGVDNGANGTHVDFTGAIGTIGVWVAMKGHIYYQADVDGPTRTALRRQGFEPSTGGGFFVSFVAGCCGGEPAPPGRNIIGDFPSRSFSFRVHACLNWVDPPDIHDEKREGDN